MEYIVGSFGYFDFKITTKVRKRNTVTSTYQLYATITEVESKQILIKDNDGFEFLVDKKDIKTFNKREFEDLSNAKQ
jgi:preprotein translocase subunit YajC